MQIGRHSDYEPDSLRAMVSAYGRNLGNKEWKRSIVRDGEMKSS